MRKTILVILIMIMLLSTSTAETSEWAKEFIEGAKSENLLPDDVNDNHRNYIKRYEYVMLANKLLDKLKIKVEISDYSPFKDIKNHSYEYEILKAYNAGIIQGYPDKTFKPNKEITREEIATLVYQLVNKISATSAKELNITYYDDKTISTWAKKYIDFCYSNKILNGVGKNNHLDTINPRGKASIEESITMIYRLFLNKKLLGQKTYEDIDGMDGKVFTQAKKYFDEDALDVIYNIAKKEQTHLSSVEGNVITFSYEDGSQLKIHYILGIFEIKLSMRNLDNKEIIDDFKRMSSLLLDSDDMGEKVDRIVEEFKKDTNYELMDSKISAIAFDDYYSINFIYRK